MAMVSWNHPEGLEVWLSIQHILSTFLSASDTSGLAPNTSS